MKVDLKGAAQNLGFNEQALLETANVLLNSKAKGRNIFSHVPDACDYALPDGMKRGSPEHGVYLMDMTILDVQMNSDSLHTKARELFKNKPYFFNPQRMFDEDKSNLYIKEVKKRDNKESSCAPVPESVMSGEAEASSEMEAMYDSYLIDNGITPVKKRKPMKIIIAPAIDKILNKDLGCGFHQQLSNRIYQTYRKLARVYDNNPENILKYVRDYPVVLSRLDSGKSKPDITREARNETKPRFSGFGPGKTAPLLAHKFVREGFANSLDRKQLPVPVDRWEINCSIKRGVTDIGKVEMGKDEYIRDLQALYFDTFSRNNIDPIDFHHALWLLGSEACVYNNCGTRKTPDGKEDLCPFLSVPDLKKEPQRNIDPCKKFLDVEAYRKKGKIVVSQFKQE